jgi:hypothetical protein
MLIIHTHTPGGAVSKSFVLYCEAKTSEFVASPMGSSGPLMASFTQPPTAYVETMIPSIDLFTPSSFSPSQTPPDE